MKRVRSFLVLVLLPLVPGVGNSFPILQNPDNGHYYQLVEAYISWTDAKAAASGVSHLGLQGHLATITCQAENDWILTNLLAPLGGSAQTGIWIGASQSPEGTEPHGGWRWDVCTGEVFGYTNWEIAGEVSPDNAGGCEEFVEIHLGSGRWGDAGNGPVPGGLAETYGYIVEYDGPARPPCPDTACLDPCGGNPACDGPTNAQCGDGIDNDQDGSTDYFGNDGGCTSPSDDSEVGSSCIVFECSDGIDNDGDGCTDYPCDAGCAGLEGAAELGGACLAPAAPAGCAAVQLGGGGVELSWSDVACETGYEVFRDGGLLVTLPGGSTLYRDEVGSSGHLYSVRATNAFGTSPACEDSSDAFGNWPQNGRRLLGPLDFYFGPAYVPTEIVPDLAGGAIVMWPTCGIQYQRVDAAGNIPTPWPEGGRTVYALDCGHYVDAMSDGGGGAFVTGSRGSSLGPYAQRVTMDGALAPGWPANGARLLNVAAYDIHVAITADGAGGAYALIPTQAYGLVLQRVAGSGQVGPPPWPSWGISLCSWCPGAFFDKPMAALRSDGSGGVYVVWVDQSNDLRCQRITSTGAVSPGWPAGDLFLARPCYTVPSLVTDGSGNLIVVVRQHSDRAAAFRVLSNGTLDPAWPAGGAEVSTTADLPVAVDDGAGGAFVVWTSYNTGVDYDIFAQHLTSAGTPSPGWPAQDLPICFVPGRQSNFSVADDGVGGFFVTWEDRRNSVFTDIYTQHVRGNGALASGWPVNGRLTCGARSYQERPAIERVGADRAIITWYDLRNGARSPGLDLSQVYAQSDAVEGFLESPADPTAVGDRVAGAFSLAVGPNPSRGVAIIELTLPEALPVSIRVMDVAGRTVRLLEAGATLPAGPVRRGWDGRDDAGMPVPSGMYWVRATAGHERRIRTVVLAR